MKDCSMIGETRYPHLFSPLDLGFTRIKNRAIMGAGQISLRGLYDELQGS